MALTSTMYRFKIDLSDIDRGIYERIELRVAQHPSESPLFLLTRVIAYLLNWQEGIEFSQGIASPDDAAIYVKDLTGRILHWIDIGTPSARRLHKAAKAADQVSVYLHKDPKILLEETKGHEIHKRGQIRVIAIAPSFLSALQEVLSRDNAWEVLYTQGELSITTRAQATFQTELTLHSLE